VRDIETFFQKVNLYFTAPYFRELIWEQIRSSVATEIEMFERYPQMAFQAEMNKFIYSNSIRFNQSLFPVERMNSTEAERQYRNFFNNADDFVFFIVGDVNIDEVKELSTRYIASLPNIKGEKTVSHNFYPPFPQGKPIIRFNKGIEEQSAVHIYFAGDNNTVEVDPAFEQVLVNIMANLIEIRLRESIREKMGASYGIDVYFRQENYPTRRFNGRIVFGCEPAKAEELARLVIHELENINAVSISELELTKLREGFIRNRETALRTNVFWKNALEMNYLYGESSFALTDSEKIISLINAETLTRLISRYINTNNYVTGILFPSRPTSGF